MRGGRERDIHKERGIEELTYPESFTQKIGFDAIVELLQEECITESAAALASRIKSVWPFGKLKLYLEQTAEFKQLLMLEKTFPSQDYYNLGTELSRLRIEGTYITLEGLQRFRASYTTLNEIKKYFSKIDPEAYPRLTEFSERLMIDIRILPWIDAILDRMGEVRDNASENLLRIRTMIRRKSADTQRYIGKYMSLAKQQGWVEDDADVTVRNERLVIPVASAYKKSMRGFVHDVSSTGQTVFMEPEEIFNLNNEIVELRNEERMEIIEILKRFTAQIRPDLDQLLQAYRFLTAIDFLRAKAKLGILLNAGMPLVEKEPCFEWREARHPILYLTLQKRKARRKSDAGGTGDEISGDSALAGSPQEDNRPDDVVPLNLCLEEKERVVIISGPNAGGKSVCLKTVGLLQYMMQCGLLVPMREDSRMGCFRNIFVDIGDEQSIENDLSTYSSHLKNMKFWVENANRQTLFLSDELGSGTEPQVGGAIAEAVVETLLKKGAMGIVTTHYTNLKLMAKHHPGIVNGAMLFDQENLRPLYVFRKGLPGSSFAFEIARKIGLPDTLLASAFKKVGRRQMDFERELQQIEVEKHDLNRQKHEVAVADELLSSTLEKYTKLLAELEEKRGALLRDAKSEAKALVKKANAEIERTIREIKEAQAEKEATMRLRKALAEEAETGFSDGQESGKPDALDKFRLDAGPEVLDAGQRDAARSTPGDPASGTDDAKSPGQAEVDKASGGKALGRKAVDASQGVFLPLAVGSWVRWNGNVAKISDVKGKQARIDFDYMSMWVAMDSLQPLSRSEARQQDESRQKASVSMAGINEGRAAFKPYADIRGMRVDEADACVRKLLDDAMLYGDHHLEILHGKGNGVLRQLVRSIVSKYPHVADYHDQREDLGGAGITIVELT